MNKFWEHFAESLYQNLNNLDDWFDRYCGLDDYTKNTIELVLTDVGKKLGYLATEIETEKQVNRQRLDFAFVKKINESMVLEYVIEHENQQSDWLDELSKLETIKRSNRVLISYYHWCNQNIESVKQEILLNCSKLNLDKNFLFIFGPGDFPRNRSHKNAVQNMDYHAFVYNENKFEDLPDIQILRRLP